MLMSEFATGDELKERECRAIERMIASAWSRGGERDAFIVEGSLAIRTGTRAAAGLHVRNRALRYRGRRFLARQTQQPVGGVVQIVGAINGPHIDAAAWVNRRRCHGVAAITAGIESRCDLAATTRYRGVTAKPDMATARRERFPRWWQRSMLRFEGTQTCLPVLAVHIEDPDARGHAGADGNITIGNPPEPSDGFRIRRGSVEAAVNGRFL